MEGIERTTLDMLHRALDTAGLQQQLHAINLTHVNNSSHSPLRLRFTDHLEMSAMSSSNRRSDVMAAAPEVYQLQGQRVQIDDEIALMAKNAIHYQALAQGVSRHLALYATALNDGR